MERLAVALSERGLQTTVVERYSPGHWRRLMSSGSLGRLRARTGAFLSFPFAAILDALQGDQRAIVATTNPFFLPFVLVFSKVLHGRVVIALLYDLYPEALEATGGGRPSAVIGKPAAWVNRFVIGNADGVVFIGEKMAGHIRSRYGSPRAQMIAETGASLREHLSFKAERQSGDPQILSYVGNLGVVHDWETVAEALSQVLNKELKLVCAASGPGVSRWERATSALPGGSAEFVGPLGDKSWRELLAKTDISLVTLRQEAAHTSIPSKVFSAMAAGCAIVAVAPEESDLADVVTSHNCGRVVTPGDVAGLVTVLDDLLSDPDELARCKAAARDAVANHYDVTLLAQKWEGFLSEVRQQRSPGKGYGLCSRLLGFVTALTVLVVTSPILVVTALMILVFMGLPVFFSQMRPGLSGKPFKLLKLRTMRRPKAGERGAEADQKRLTDLGRFLRATSLDELPTFWNVLKGEMSLVGPRPLLMEYLDRYSARQARRHDVKPGITGWAQVNGRNAITWEEKFDLDLLYVENQGLWLDFKILVLTVLKVFKREGISSSDHATMQEFMGSERTTSEAGDD